MSALASSVSEALSKNSGERNFSSSFTKKKTKVHNELSFFQNHLLVYIVSHRFLLMVRKSFDSSYKVGKDKLVTRTNLLSTIPHI